MCQSSDRKALNNRILLIRKFVTEASSINMYLIIPSPFSARVLSVTSSRFLILACLLECVVDLVSCACASLAETLRLLFCNLFVYENASLYE